MELWYKDRWMFELPLLVGTPLEVEAMDDCTKKDVVHFLMSSLLVIPRSGPNTLRNMFSLCRVLLQGREPVTFL